MNTIPEQISQFNIYNQYDKLVGTTNEITLPSFEAQTNTMSGAGINGEYESTVAGCFGSSEMEIPFRLMDKQAAELLKTAGTILFIRAAVQEKDPSTLKLVNKSLKITVGGNPKGVSLGTVGGAKTMDSSVKLEVTYFKHEYDGTVLLEVDKLNNIYVVNGEDQLMEIKSMI